MKRELQTIRTTPRTTAHDQSELTGYILEIGQMKRKDMITQIYT